MKKLAIAAALLLTVSTAQAGQNYSFEIGGRTVRIHAPRGCDSPLLHLDLDPGPLRLRTQEFCR
jgi:hypothetical protein